MSRLGVAWTMTWSSPPPHPPIHNTPVSIMLIDPYIKKYFYLFPKSVMQQPKKISFALLNGRVGLVFPLNYTAHFARTAFS